MRLLLPFLKTVIFLAIVSGCANDTISSQEEELDELNNLKEEIELLAASGNCTENSDCDFIAFGSKPCGGPWSYIVFNTSIDIAALNNKVQSYNEMEHTFNQKWGIMSDCSMVLPPMEVTCIDGNCTAIYN